ncbi:hypothetical protein FA13DRAFT_1746440, partial [Coprinellus micaceus]
MSDMWGPNVEDMCRRVCETRASAGGIWTLECMNLFAFGLCFTSFTAKKYTKNSLLNVY